MHYRRGWAALTGLMGLAPPDNTRQITAFDIGRRLFHSSTKSPCFLSLLRHSIGVSVERAFSITASCGILSVIAVCRSCCDVTVNVTIILLSHALNDKLRGSERCLIRLDHARVLETYLCLRRFGNASYDQDITRADY